MFDKNVHTLFVDKKNLYTLLTFVLHSMVAAATALSLMSISSIAFNKKKRKKKMR